MRPSPLLLSGLLIAATMQAQDSVRLPLAASFGPVRMVQGQTLRVCVNNLFSNALTTNQMPAKPLVVVVAFVDALNGVLHEPARTPPLDALKGVCEEFRVPESLAETTALVLLAPLSHQDPKQFSSELLPISSATLFEGSGPAAHLLAMVPLAPKANILIPRGRR